MKKSVSNLKKCPTEKESRQRTDLLNLYLSMLIRKREKACTPDAARIQEYKMKL
jgi:hypothetical protein